MHLASGEGGKGGIRHLPHSPFPLDVKGVKIPYKLKFDPVPSDSPNNTPPLNLLVEGILHSLILHFNIPPKSIAAEYS